MKNTYVAIMAGGIGSRFWPVSRANHPKQFMDILGLGKSLLRLTYERFLDVCPAENIYIITNKDYVELVKKDIPEMTYDQILGEPMRKNTAPCVAYVSHKIASQNPHANMVVSPADHIILKETLFHEVFHKAVKAAEQNDCLITLGIKPSRPDTGYGYIQFEESDSVDEVYKVKTFTEKPTLDVAESFLESGDYLWNSGMFVWSVKSILKSFEENMPEVDDLFKEGKDLYFSDEEEKFIEKTYSFCPSISIDYGIMEKADNVCVIPADIDWSDLGTWSSIYDNITQKDENQNVVNAKHAQLYNSKNCMIMAPENKMIVLQDLNDYIVVDTSDALLVVPKSKEQHIKQITADLKKNKKEPFL